MYLEPKPAGGMNDSVDIENERRRQPLRTSVAVSLKLYLNKLGNNKPSDLYRMVIDETEYALFKTILEYTGGNQSRAAEYLGISRGTFRKKIAQLGLGNQR